MPSQPWWWLLPLPRSKDGLPESELASVVGWLPILPRLKFWAALIAAALFGLQFTTLVVAFVCAELIATPIECFFIEVLAVVVGSVTVLVALDWFRPLRWPDQGPEILDVNLYSRRKITISAATGLAALLFVPTGNLLASLRGREGFRQTDSDLTNRWRRLRRKRVLNGIGDLKDGQDLVLNKKSGVLHFVRRQNDGLKDIWTIGRGSNVPVARSFHRAADVFRGVALKPALPSIHNPKKKHVINPRFRAQELD